MVLLSACGAQTGATAASTAAPILSSEELRRASLSEVPTSTCSTGLEWTGTRGSNFAHPGQDCIGCHTRENCRPSFTIAGTVNGALHEADDCAGVSGVVVEVTGADGAVLRLTTNASGNFFTQQRIALPYRVRLLSDAGTTEMAGAQTSGQCASCHSAAGLNGAPGRILAPQ